MRKILIIILALMYLSACNKDTIQLNANNIHKTKFGIGLIFDKSWKLQDDKENIVLTKFQDKEVLAKIEMGKLLIKDDFSKQISSLIKNTNKNPKITYFDLNDNPAILFYAKDIGSVFKNYTFNSEVGDDDVFAYIKIQDKYYIVINGYIFNGPTPIIKNEIYSIIKSIVIS
jgi:hypothetical protein